MVLVVWNFFLILKKERSVTETIPYWNLLLNLYSTSLITFRGAEEFHRQAAVKETFHRQALNWQAGTQLEATRQSHLL